MWYILHCNTYTINEQWTELYKIRHSYGSSVGVRISVVVEKTVWSCAMSYCEDLNFKGFIYPNLVVKQRK